MNDDNEDIKTGSLGTHEPDTENEEDDDYYYDSDDGEEEEDDAIVFRNGRLPATESQRLLHAMSACFGARLIVKDRTLTEIWRTADDADQDTRDYLCWFVRELDWAYERRPSIPWISTDHLMGQLAKEKGIEVPESRFDEWGDLVHYSPPPSIMRQIITEEELKALVKKKFPTINIDSI